MKNCMLIKKKILTKKKKNFPESIRLETKSSLQDGNKSENPDWERDVLNLKKDYKQRYLYFSIIASVSVPKFLKWVYLKVEFEYDILQTLHAVIQEFSPNPLC